jgi:3-hydroxyacyl-CoA dehydrogenase / 3-hydroxy-2-methylbutyryl-CoA dehydrogenase
MKVEDSVFLIAGGANGLGDATVRRVVERGGKVGILDLPSSAGPAVAAELGDAVVFRAADVRDAAQVEEAVEGVVAELGELDVCVSTAGIATTHRMVKRSGERFPVDLFRQTIEINLIGTFHVVRSAVGSMIRKGVEPGGEAGVIVNTASIAAFDGQTGQIAYTASKAAIHGLGLPLARDLGPAGIRVMTIAPGIMGTKMLTDFPEDLQARLIQDHIYPQRAGQPTEYADLVCTIVESEMLNGSTIRLDAAARLSP